MQSVVDSAIPSTSSGQSVCPICDKKFPVTLIEQHADQCAMSSENHSEDLEDGQETLCVQSSSTQVKTPKRNYSIFGHSPSGSAAKKKRTQTMLDRTVDELESDVINIEMDDENKASQETKDAQITDRSVVSLSVANSNRLKSAQEDSSVPLAERARPEKIEDYVGQEQIIGRNTILRTLFDSGAIPSMIFWGPPGCGKTTLANIIANHCKNSELQTRFVKLSAAMSGTADVKDAVNKAKNEKKYKRKTILFMDEIHRFNKLQQDIFLPHVEAGTITLIGATTENPSFSLNSALLSRCRVIVLEKHSVESMLRILERALPQYDAVMLADNNNTDDVPDFSKLSFVPRIIIKEETVRWLAETCDGDARIGLNSLQLALRAKTPLENESPSVISLEDIREGIKKSHLLYDRKGDQHYDLISALHKSIRASDDNAALYWVTRLIASGEDPRYICRRMIRMASEDIGMADTNALQVATTTLAAVQAVGMPEADCILAHCAVYLARTSKSREVYEAFKTCRASIENWKGPMPGVPLHLRNAPTKLMKDLHYGAGYNYLQKNESGLTYMPEGLEDERYFSD
ncbi:ATPase WRNIP1-like [Anopheles cruzii]|uniref:ATPase WRNIP1-like n=1 Tax=Anopheles cruzii TaxID=68878 RepID=UPI0022EC4A59|nr:ATPase WRNIP1-like [Anopheles cruzii]